MTGFPGKRLIISIISILILLTGCLSKDKPAQQTTPQVSETAKAGEFAAESPIQQNPKAVSRGDIHVAASAVSEPKKAPRESVPSKKSNNQVQKSIRNEPAIAKIKGLRDTQQAILVSTNSFKASTARLTAYEKSNGQWKEVLSPVKAMIGRNGLTWTKEEGDGKSPVGIFSLKTCYGREGNPGTKLNYITFGENSFWVDDSKSQYYNTFQKGPSNGRWSSAEDLYKIGGTYKYFISVEYNTERIIPGKGSAIFIHIWEGDDISTSGCIAMSESNLLKIVKWLDPSKKPKVILAPISELDKM